MDSPLDKAPSRPPLNDGSPGQAEGVTPAAGAAGGPPAVDAASWAAGRFQQMIPNGLAYARDQHSRGRPLVGIMCEYTPREIILAAGALPVCLCGGSQEMIPAAEEHLPSGLCPLIKSTYGYHLRQANPFLEMADLLVAETTCDGKKKMYELMARTRELFILELPHGQDETAEAGLRRWQDEMARFRSFLRDRYQVPITDDELRAAIRRMNEERGLRREIAGLMRADPPPLTGSELLDLKSIVSCVPCDLTAYRLILAELRADHRRTPERDRVRVLLTGVPLVHGAERVMNLIESNGGLVVCAENCTGLKPILEDVDAEARDPLRALAEKYYHLPCSVMTPNHRRLESLRRLAVEYRAECLIELIWQGCLTYQVEAHLVRELAESELALPYLRIETDYSPADSARIAVRIEALCETVRQGRSSCRTPS